MIRHEPLGCRRCGTGLAGARETGAEGQRVNEIRPVKAEVTEHQMIEMECPCCGERTKADAPDGVTAPVQYGLRASALGTYLWHGQFLSRDRACAALGEMFSCAPFPGALAAQARKIAGFISSAMFRRSAGLSPGYPNLTRSGKRWSGSCGLLRQVPAIAIIRRAESSCGLVVATTGFLGFKRGGP